MKAFAEKSSSDTQAEKHERQGSTMRPVRKASDLGISFLDQSVLQRKASCACGGGCPRCQSEQVAHERLQSKQAQPNNSLETTVPPVVHEVLHSSGQPMEPTTQEFMESRMGRDFSQVRVHTDARAAEAASAINARAFTVNHDIVFGSGEYAPQTESGRRLHVSHELTHVVQQQAGTKLSESVEPQEDHFEQHADAVADRVVRGEFPDDLLSQATIQTATSIQRKEPEPDTEAKPYTREEINRLIGNQMNMALGAFNIASVAVGVAKKAEAKAKAELANSAIEILMGLAIPGLAGKVSSIALKYTKIIAVAGTISGSTTMLSFAEVGKQIANNPKILETMLKTLTKIGTKEISNNATQLFGETDTDRFIENLRAYFRSFITAVDMHVSFLTDNEAAALLLTFDENITSENAYTIAIESLVSQFEREIIDIDKWGIFSGPARDQNAAWITYKGEKKLAIVHERPASRQYAVTGDYELTPGYHFITFISDKFQSMALERSKEKFGGPWNLVGVTIYELPDK